MGNNNFTGQGMHFAEYNLLSNNGFGISLIIFSFKTAIIEETANVADKTIQPLNGGSPGLNSTNREINNGKDGTEDVNLSKSPKDPIITTSEDKEVVSYQNISSDNTEDLDEKNKGSIQDNTSTQEADQSSNLPRG
ncbi:unnamed protein product [Urochloa decumbens]|uniref:Uncharacterized protein n=1 Tax=Urochloa decumbens TaxID=240449 RepID=A0ABC9A9B2_9POAL